MEELIAYQELDNLLSKSLVSCGANTFYIDKSLLTNEEIDRYNLIKTKHYSVYEKFKFLNNFYHIIEEKPKFFERIKIVFDKIKQRFS